jgi:parallel beta-helix repeat protein
VLDCDNHKINGRNQTGYGVRIRKFNFPLLETPTNIEIKNCKLTSHRTAIVAEAGNTIYIHENDLSRNYDDTNVQRYGIFLGSTEAGGVRFDGVRNARIENNQANDQAIGFDIRNSDHITLKANTAERNSAWGISLIKTTYSEVIGNTMRDNVRSCTWGDNKTVGRGCDAGGIFLQNGSSHNVIRDNVVTGDNGNGIFIKAHGFECGDDNLIQNNKIVGALYNAIEFSFCKDNRIIGNEITNSLDAIFFGFTQNTEIRNNTIRDMRNHGIISWNSRSSIVDSNQVTNSREGIFFYWDLWDTKQFALLPPSPDKYASR